MRNGEFLRQINTDSNANWLIQNLIPICQIILFGGLPGGGKTFLALILAYYIAYGATFLERCTNKSSVLLLDNENPREVLISRINKIKAALNEDGYSDYKDVDIQNFSGIRLDDTGTWDEVKAVINEIHPSLIVIDHLRCFHSQNEDSSTGMQRVVNGIKSLQSICGSSILILHHFGKGVGNFYKKLRGSSVIYANSDVAMEVRALSHSAGKLDLIGIIPQPRKGETPHPFRVAIVENEHLFRLRYDGEYSPVENPVLDDLAHLCCHRILEDKDQKTVNDFKTILAGMGSDNEIREALRSLKQKDVVGIREEGRNHKYVYHGITNICPWCGTRF